MIIESIHIESFGTLEHRDFALSPGVNIIEGANESGKSTLAAFIKFMLYGCPAKERDAIASWKSGGAAGSITFTENGRRYRIERAMMGNREAVQLIDAATNMPIRGALDGKTPGELFFGMDAGMFSATAFVSQLGANPGGEKVSEGIENILFSADEAVNTQKALAKLDSARAAILHKNEKGGRLYELNNECAELEVRLAAALKAHQEILTDEAQLADIRANHAVTEEKAKTVSAKVAQFEAVTVLGLFERMRALERKTAEIKRAIEDSGAPDPAFVNEIGGMMERLAVLRRECEDAAARRDAVELPELPETLRAYRDEGGRDAAEEKIRSARMVGKTYRIVGVIALVLALAVLAVGLVPMLAGGKPQIGFIIGGAVTAALAVTLFILGGRSDSHARELEESGDFDAMDAALADYNAAVDAVKYNELAAEDAKRRLDEARAEAKRVTGAEPDALGELRAALTEQLRDVEGQKAEYDKHMTLLNHMRQQLSTYNETELRDRLDASIDISDIDASTLPAMRREAEVASRMAASLARHEVELDKTLTALTATAEDPTKLSDILNAKKLERDALAKKHDAYKLACEKLAEASEHLRESIAPRLASDAALLMRIITDGKYRELGVGAALDMTADTMNGQQPLSLLSMGTQDAAYLCLRLALVRMLYRDTMPPMIYDEAFVRQDDGRLKNFFRLLATQDAQSLVFTSNHRDAAMMQTVGEFKRIEL
ncbi:MAG: hypothetical protein E7632_00780 [Ruminococcaceae bacterium]|nr:hypothetical protein [Oscillospiraceae bacterium]